MEKIIIIGAGPAGISAALYAARANMDPLVINNGIGALEKAEKIEKVEKVEKAEQGENNQKMQNCECKFCRGKFKRGYIC